MPLYRLAITILFISTLSSGKVAATEINVAVASNFAQCFETLTEDFTRRTGIDVVISPGSTGRHYAQIKAGAPFDIFLAADAHRPELLEKDGLIQPGSRFTYAQGRLVFWCPTLCGNEMDQLNPKNLIPVFTQPGIKHFAVANPRLAPYGKAAQQVLEYLGIESMIQQNLVSGQNVSQTWQFVASGNAEAGLVALSQVMDSEPGSWYLIPDNMHDPIIQQGVLLAGNGRKNQREDARRLIQYLQSTPARDIMASFGYENDDEIKK